MDIQPDFIEETGVLLSTPVAFCGVNNFTPKRIQGQRNIIGINKALLPAPHYRTTAGERLCG